jgi:2'-5' RNA ligase
VRLFVAAELEAGATAALAAVSSALRRRTQALAPHAKLTWVGADRLHLTVRFVGELDDATATRVQQALAPPIAVAPFELTLEGLGVFPPKGPARVVWVGINAGRDGMVAVEREVSARLERCGLPRESRAYSPHLTLARVRDAGGLRSRALLDGAREAGEAPRGVSSRVDAITLFQSRLSPKGPTYVPLLHTPLRG